MRFALAWFTPNGGLLAERVARALEWADWAWPDWTDGTGRGPEAEGHAVAVFDKSAESLQVWFRREFAVADALLVIGATGIAVRMLDGLMRGKERDPAVLVLDEKGEFVIPLLSGHLGGANRLAVSLAQRLGARAVITTATDVNGVFAVDEWAAAHGCAIGDISRIKAVSAALLRGETVGFCSDFPVSENLPAGLVAGEGRNVGVCVSVDAQKAPFGLTLNLIPKMVILGAGCRKDIPAERFERAVLETLSRHGVSVESLKTLASIDIKCDEACLTAFARKYGLDFRVFSAETLRAVPGSFTASAFVRERVGVDNVCERAAMAAGGERLILSKTVVDGITLALAVPAWRCVFA